MKGILYRLSGFLVLAFFAPAPVCHAQKAIPKATENTWLPAKKFTLADPEMQARRQKINFELYTKWYSRVSRSGPPSFSGLENLGWGWFCQAEYRFRQTTKVPLYLRLGSVQQTDWLEGKQGR